MRRITLAALAVTFLLPFMAASTAGADSDGAALERVQRYVAALDTLRAEFTQELRDAAGTVREEADGVLMLAKPGRFRWDYRNPSEQLLVSDGRTVWLYDVELEQVTVRAAGQSLSTTPAMLLSGTGRVEDSFSVSDDGAADGLDWVRLVPKLDDTDFRMVRLGFSGTELARMELSDRLGQVTRIEFSRIERNPVLEPGLFTFTPPPGVDVVGTAASP